MMRVLGIVGSPSPGGKTAAVVRAVLDGAAGHGEVETELLSLCDYDIAFADGTRSTDWTGDTRVVLDKVESADAFVFGTPIYREGPTGRMKNLLDLIPRGMWDGPTCPLQGRPVGVVATAASPEHFLATHDLQGKLASFFAAYVVPLGIYASGDYSAEDGTITDEYLAGRTKALGQALVALSRAIGDSSALRSVEPQIRYRSI
jgi:FMN reductase